MTEVRQWLAAALGVSDAGLSSIDEVWRAGAPDRQRAVLQRIKVARSASGTVREVAGRLGVSLMSVDGSGEDGRLTIDDVFCAAAPDRQEQFVSEIRAARRVGEAAAAASAAEAAADRDYEAMYPAAGWVAAAGDAYERRRMAAAAMSDDELWRQLFGEG